MLKGLTQVFWHSFIQCANFEVFPTEVIFYLLIVSLCAVYEDIEKLTVPVFYAFVFCRILRDLWIHSYNFKGSRWFPTEVISHLLIVSPCILYEDGIEMLTVTERDG